MRKEPSRCSDGLWAFKVQVTSTVGIFKDNVSPLPNCKPNFIFVTFRSNVLHPRTVHTVRTHVQRPNLFACAFTQSELLHRPTPILTKPSHVQRGPRQSLPAAGRSRDPAMLFGAAPSCFVYTHTYVRAHVRVASMNSSVILR